MASYFLRALGTSQPLFLNTAQIAIECPRPGRISSSAKPRVLRLHVR
jgi:hypothetical protein